MNLHRDIRYMLKDEATRIRKATESFGRPIIMSIDNVIDIPHYPRRLLQAAQLKRNAIDEMAWAYADIGILEA